MLLSRLPSGDAEIFATVQGEGPSAGTPSVFVRLADCNLRCSFCDTKYTWDWAHYDRGALTVELGCDEVEARVVEVAGDRVTNAVVTGGEPLLQQRALVELTTRLRGRGYRIEVETNGSITPTETLAATVDQWNVSPKLASSGNADRARHRPSTLAWFSSCPSAIFKFVVSSDEDIVEVRSIVDALGIPKERVLVMPEGTDAATLSDRSRWLADQCLAHGYRLGTRLHVFVWGNERGR